jgi:hypothetical protein
MEIFLEGGNGWKTRVLIYRGNGGKSETGKRNSEYSPYAGITQIRFNGYNLRPLSHPKCGPSLAGGGFSVNE